MSTATVATASICLTLATVCAIAMIVCGLLWGVLGSPAADVLGPVTWLLLIPLALLGWAGLVSALG